MNVKHNFNSSHLFVSLFDDSEIPMVFNFIAFLTGMSEETLAQQVLLWWTTFAQSGSQFINLISSAFSLIFE